MLTLEAVICPHCSELGSVPSQREGSASAIAWTRKGQHHTSAPLLNPSVCGPTSKRVPTWKESSSVLSAGCLIPLFIHSLVHSLIHSLVHSFTHSFLHSFTRSFLHSFIPSLVHSHIHSFTHSFLHRTTISWGLLCPGIVLGNLAIHRSQGHFLNSRACIQVGDTEHLKGAIR